jgi:hypothetical protein
MFFLVQSSHLDARPFCAMQNIFNFFATNMRFHSYTAKKNQMQGLPKRFASIAI